MAGNVPTPNPAETYRLTLYIVDGGASTQELAQRIRDWFQQRDLALDLTVVDVLANLEQAIQQQIFATPTLVREAPPPQGRVIGEVSATAAAMRLLEIPGGD